MFDTMVEEKAESVADWDAADWDAEDRLAWELTEAAMAAASTIGDPAGEERLCLPADLDAWPVGVGLVMLLSAVDVNRLSPADRVGFLRAADRANSAGQARFLGAVAAVADAYDDLAESIEDPEAGASLELRSALRWTRRAAETELGLAHDLRVRLPGLFEALAAGIIDRRRMVVMVRGTDHLPIAHARMVIDALIGEAHRLTTGQLTETVRRACLDLDPASARLRYQQSRSSRRLEAWTDPDGTVTLAGIGLDPVAVAAAKDRINRQARTRKTRDPSRSLDQHRADVYLDLLNGRPANHSDGDWKVRAGRIHLLVDLATLTGLTQNAGDLAGYGPVIADIARQTAHQLDGAVWDWTVTHPDTGMALTDGTTRRRPTASQTRRIRTSNRTCVAPGCRMPTIDCDIDHTRTWAATATTTTNHLAPLCRHDHCIRHQTGWTYHKLPNGDYQWHSPLHTTYTTTGADPP